MISLSAKHWTAQTLSSAEDQGADLQTVGLFYCLFFFQHCNTNNIERVLYLSIQCTPGHFHKVKVLPFLYQRAFESAKQISSRICSPTLNGMSHPWSLWDVSFSSWTVPVPGVVATVLVSGHHSLASAQFPGQIGQWQICHCCYQLYLF